jgi:hypothetical protein
MHTTKKIAAAIKAALTSSDLNLKKVSVTCPRGMVKVVVTPNFRIMNPEYLSGVEGARILNDVAWCQMDKIRNIVISLCEDLSFTADYSTTTKRLERKIFDARRELEMLNLEADRRSLRANFAKSC